VEKHYFVKGFLHDLAEFMEKLVGTTHSAHSFPV
jgi:hypothetical protein